MKEAFIFEIKQYPEFSWSLARQQTFQTCRRQYAYHYYYSHNGWLQYNVAEETKHVYRLKKITSLPLLFGTIVHDVIAKSLQQFFQLRLQPSLQQLIEDARHLLNEAYLDSTMRRDAWFARPSRHTMLTDFYYGDGFDPEQVATYRERLKPTFQNFLRSETWRMIEREPERFDFIQLEDFATVSIFDTKVFVVLDLLLFDRQTNRYIIIDWKTGKSSASDHQQLVLYSIYVLLNYGASLDDIDLCNEYLKDGTRAVHAPTQLELQHMTDVFQMSVEEMLHYVADPSINAPLPLDSYERTTDEWKCRQCNYREICLPT